MISDVCYHGEPCSDEDRLLQITAFRAFSKTGGLWGRPLQAIDCQGLFCETDKYCREAAPELASARKRIKARFSPASEPVRLFFPPKWAINDKLPSRPVPSSTNPVGHTQHALLITRYGVRRFWAEDQRALISRCSFSPEVRYGKLDRPISEA
jgi:hypothetical protein